MQVFSNRKPWVWPEPFLHTSLTDDVENYHSQDAFFNPEGAPIMREKTLVKPNTMSYSICPKGDPW